MIDHTDGSMPHGRVRPVGGVSRLAPGGTVTVDMLRAFVCLADTLNLSVASQQLGVTRQTLRRNIDQIEALRGCRLFELHRGRYTLSAKGAECLPDAREILTWCDSWNSGSRFRIRRINGFEHARYLGVDGQNFYSEQHSISSLARGGLPLLQQMFAAWGQSLAQLDHPAMDRLRPYLVIYRRTGKTWVFADVGEESAYARWFGQSYARSARGAAYDNDRAGSDFNEFISRAYLEVHDGGGIRLDHLYVHIPEATGQASGVLSYQRLMAGCVLPDGSQALAMLAAATNKIEIAALKSVPISRIDQSLVMDEVRAETER